MANIGTRLSVTVIWVLVGLGTGGLQSFAAPTHDGDSVSITLLHTNDLHSHFRAEKTPLALGGIARLKTAIQAERKKSSHALLVDGGDWSEGSIYYTLGTGVQTIQMMDLLGYDAAVIGNHDWLNGPDVLLDVLKEAKPKTSFISANLSPRKYSRANEFRNRIPRYVTRTIEGVKIAFIGLSTYEFIYDSFISPVKVKEPFLSTRRLAAKLKHDHIADAVVVISHNSILINQRILKMAPAVDLIIGAHDHVKLTRPVVVNRSGAKPGWIVETGNWGRYLGRVDLTVSASGVGLKNYQLVQIDTSIPEDPEVLDKIQNLEQEIEARDGPVFHDQIGRSEIELSKAGEASSMGNLVTDAYLKASQADFALESAHFVYGEVHVGPITLADAFNAIPAIFNPVTQKTWTLRTVPIKGSHLKKLLNFLYTSSKLAQAGQVYSSGLEFVFKPLFSLNEEASHVEVVDRLLNPEPLLSPELQISAVQDIRIQGRPLDPKATYQMATGGGVIEAIRFVQKVVPRFIPLDGMKDTGVENWRVLAEYLRAQSPITEATVSGFQRGRTQSPNLALSYNRVNWCPIVRIKEGMKATVRVSVTNYGAAASSAGSRGPLLHLLVNKNGDNYAIDPEYAEVGASQEIPSLAPGSTSELVWDVVLPPIPGKEHFSVTARIEGNTGETRPGNDEVTRWFTEEAPQESELLTLPPQSCTSSANGRYNYTNA